MATVTPRRRPTLTPPDLQRQPVKRVEIFVSRLSRLWYWRGVAGNRRGIAFCGEGYTQRKHCASMASRLFPGVPQRRVAE